MRTTENPCIAALHILQAYWWLLQFSFFPFGKPICPSNAHTNTPNATKPIARPNYRWNAIWQPRPFDWLARQGKQERKTSLPDWQFSAPIWSLSRGKKAILIACAAHHKGKLQPKARKDTNASPVFVSRSCRAGICYRHLENKNGHKIVPFL